MVLNSSSCLTFKTPHHEGHTIMLTWQRAEMTLRSPPGVKSTWLYRGPHGPMGHRRQEGQEGGICFWPGVTALLKGAPLWSGCPTAHGWFPGWLLVSNALCHIDLQLFLPHSFPFPLTAFDFHLLNKTSVLLLSTQDPLSERLELRQLF